MNVVYILFWYGVGSMTPTPPFADMDSCQKVQAIAHKRGATSAECVQVTVLTPSEKAYYYVPNKIAK